MKKRRLLKFLTTLSIMAMLFSAGTVLINSLSANKNEENVVAQSVTFDSILWNNIDYASPILMPGETSSIPKNGYVILLSYSALFSPSSTDNFVYTNIQYSSHIKVNGVSINTIDGCSVRIFSGYLYIYFAKDGLTYTGDYYRPTIEIDANTDMFNLNLPYCRIEYMYNIGANNFWEVTTNASKTKRTYSGITWNNAFYVPELYPLFNGKKGLLISYDSNISTHSFEANNIFVQERNLAKTNIGDKVLLNNIPFSQIDGAEIKYFNTNLVWFYTPSMTAIPAGNRFGKLEIAEEFTLFDSIIPTKVFYFNSTNQLWIDYLLEATYDSIFWNNVDYWCKCPDYNNLCIPQSGYVITVQFKEAIGPGSTQGSTTDVNMANENYDVGYTILVNGVQVKDISGAMVGSYILANHLYIYIPDVSITYSGEYTCPTIEISEGCIFGNYILPSMSFSYRAGIGSRDSWYKDLEPGSSEIAIDSITGNNTDYGIYGGKKGILLKFNQYLSKYSEEFNGQIKDRDLTKTIIGDLLYLNGERMSKIQGAEIKYYAKEILWIYSSTMTIPTNGFKVANLTLKTPCQFFDVILPSFNMNFRLSAWTIEEKSFGSVANFKEFYQDVNNLDLGNGYRRSFLSFDMTFSSTQKDIDLIKTDSDFVNNVTINGIPLKNIPGASVAYAHLGIVDIVIPSSYLSPMPFYPVATLDIPDGTRLFDGGISSTKLYLNSTTNKWAVLENDLIVTNTKANFKTTGISNQISGLSFENRINYNLYSDLKKVYKDEEISFGTYIVPKTNYINSGEDSVIDYINNNVPSSLTYADIKNTGKDFVNASSMVSDGYGIFYASMYNLKPSHYAEGYIGVGYVIAGENIYFGNKTDVSTSYYELLEDAYYKGSVSADKFVNTMSFTTTDVSFELVDTSVVKTNHVVTKDLNEYYKVVTNTYPIKTIVVDGYPMEVDIPANSTRYFSYYNGAIDVETELVQYHGIGEIVYDIFPDFSNSNTVYTNAENVSTLNSLFGSNSMRIWVDINTGFALNKYSMTDPDGTYRLDPEKVARMHDILKQFTDKGAKKLTLNLSGFAYSYDSPIFCKNGTWYSYSESLGLDPNHYNIIPCQDQISYQNYLNANESMAYEIAKEFPEFDVIELLPELDGGGYKLDPEYMSAVDKGETPTITNIDTVVSWGMDLCYAVSKGVKKAHSSMKVTCPAATCADYNGVTIFYNSKDFIRRSYQYIENSKDTVINNYFSLTDLHPYVFSSKVNVGEDSVYLWDDKPSKYYPHAFTNTDYDTDWVNYVGYIHNTIMAEHNDSYKSLTLTEIGFSDMGGTTDANWKYANYNNQLATATEKVIKKIKSLSYITSVSWFRMFDFPIKGYDPFGGCLEANFGLIEEDKTLKEAGKKVYQAWNNGSKDYSAITNFLANMKARA